jgi:hypothetical protein
MANYILFVFSAVASTLIIYSIRNMFFKKIMLLYYLAWHVPLVIALFFPFNSPMELEPVVTGGILSLMHIILLPGVIFNFKRLSCASTPFEITKTVNRSIMLKNRIYLIAFCEILSYLATIFVFIDLYLLRGLSLVSGDIEANRGLFASTDPTLLGYIGLIGSAMSLFSLTLSYDPQLKKIRLRSVIPFAIISIFYLLSGNRQFLLFGLLLIVIQSSYYSELTIGKYMAKISRWAVIFMCLMMVFQFTRQTQTKGKQFEFLQSITLLECTDKTVADSALLVPLAYLYVYYGIEYQAISLLLSVDNSRIDVPLSSMTFPLLYRRIYPVFHLDDPTVVNQRMLDYIEYNTGMAPLFWVTMYSSIYLESGFLGLILVVLLAALINARLIRLCLKDHNFYSYVQISVFYSSLIYGIMSPATTDPIFLFLIIFVTFFRIRPPTNRSCTEPHCRISSPGTA